VTLVTFKKNGKPGKGNKNGPVQLNSSPIPTPPDNIGPRSTPNYDALAAAAVTSLPGGIKVFAGQRDDPFFVDLGSIFDLGGLRPFSPFHLIRSQPSRAWTRPELQHAHDRDRFRSRSSSRLRLDDRDLCQREPAAARAQTTGRPTRRATGSRCRGSVTR
jgi:hypothetical protein